MRNSLSSGVSGSTGKTVASIMRLGPGSVSDQFKQQRGQSVSRGTTPWPKSHPFGECTPGSPTLRKTGQLYSAWIGRDSASITRAAKNSVTIGVGPQVPQAAVFQSRIPVLTKAKRRGPSGRLAMQSYLGLGECKIWVSESRLLKGFIIEPRPVGVSRLMLARIGTAIVGRASEGRIA